MEAKTKPSYRCPTCGKVLQRAKRVTVIKESEAPKVKKVIVSTVERGGPVVITFN